MDIWRRTNSGALRTGTSFGGLIFCLTTPELARPALLHPALRVLPGQQVVEETGPVERVSVCNHQLYGLTQPPNEFVAIGIQKAGQPPLGAATVAAGSGASQGLNEANWRTAGTPLGQPPQTGREVGSTSLALTDASEQRFDEGERRWESPGLLCQ
jgi:hypothetical protein